MMRDAASSTKATAVPANRITYFMLPDGIPELMLSKSQTLQVNWFLLVIFSLTFARPCLYDEPR
jgi:hypothetical protein